MWKTLAQPPFCSAAIMWKLLVFALLVIGAQGRPSSDVQEVADDVCKEGDTVANTVDCRKFKVCKNNQLVEDHCMWPRKFDSAEKKCMWWGAKCAVPVVLSRQLQSVNLEADVCKEGDKIADPENCRKYEVCKDNKLVDDHCWWPRKFDSVENRCMWWGAKCAVPVTVPPTPATESTTPATESTTPATESTTPATESTPPVPVPSTAPVVRRKLQSVNEDVCKEGDRVADKDDCRKYQVCEDNKLVDDHCWWPRKFDSVENKCMWWGATCASK